VPRQLIANDKKQELQVQGHRWLLATACSRPKRCKLVQSILIRGQLVDCTALPRRFSSCDPSRRASAARLLSRCRLSFCLCCLLFCVDLSHLSCPAPFDFNAIFWWLAWTTLLEPQVALDLCSRSCAGPRPRPSASASTASTITIVTLGCIVFRST
jgi:hypothetical protein